MFMRKAMGVNRKSMIIQVRGTSGSGKSTAMRAFMEGAGCWNGVQVSGRRRPLYYRHEDLSVAVLGHYESPCGGCDTIGSARAVYALVQDLLGSPQPPRVIVCEGLLLSEDTKWSLQMPDLRALFLTTALGECLDRIRLRRQKAGNDKPLDESNTANRVRTIDRAYAKLREAGIYCRRCSSSQAPGILAQWVGDSTR